MAKGLKKLTDNAGSGVTASATAPASPTTGAQWYDTNVHALKIYNGTAWIIVGGSGGGLIWTSRASGYTATSGDGIITNTSAAVVTITLPLAPALNDKVGFMDLTGTWSVNNLTIVRNGQTIMGSATDLIANVSNKNFRLVFTGTDWRIT